MDKLKLIGRNLGRVCKSRLGHAFVKCHAIAYKSKGPNLKLKTRPKQLLGSLPLAFALPDLTHSELLKYLKPNSSLKICLGLKKVAQMTKICPIWSPLN